jgi:two-component system chemotaxis sensor kinase CheA
MLLPDTAHLSTTEIETLLSDIRGRLILHARNETVPDSGDEIFTWTERLCTSIKLTDCLSETDISQPLSESIGALGSRSGENKAELVRNTLDTLTDLEAALFSAGGDKEPFELDITNFIDASFGELMPRQNVPLPPTNDLDGFEVDAELVEIFSGEADELLRGIEQCLEKLAADPNDSASLWQIRRNAHTFKGAAGAVGLVAASKIAHRIEDLLDRFAEKETGSGSSILELLRNATRCLRSIAESDDGYKPEDLELLHRSFDTALSRFGKGHETSAFIKTSSKTPVENTEQAAVLGHQKRSIIRVSPEKLDELETALHQLVTANSAIEDRLADLDVRSGGLVDLFGRQSLSISAIQDALLRIRMVEFGTIKMRLQRTARVTADEVGRDVELSVLNETTKIDTQMLDLLSEPLMHLVRNAVVHGIEPSEIRRLLGKNETGQINVAFVSEETHCVLTISDDGAGISASRLKEKAFSAGLLTRMQARDMAEQDTYRLIFEPGLSTAVKLSMSAGRGVGMSIVKAGIEGAGGTVEIHSKPQSGTRITIRVPLKPSKTDKPTIRTILIVDDSPSIRHFAAAVVENAGWNSVTACDGIEALDYIATSRELPSVILTDIEMPRMHGLDLIRSIRSNSVSAGIPVIVASSLSGTEHREIAGAMGVTKFLSKPIIENELIETIRNVT